MRGVEVEALAPAERAKRLHEVPLDVGDDALVRVDEDVRPLARRDRRLELGGVRAEGDVQHLEAVWLPLGRALEVAHDLAERARLGFVVGVPDPHRAPRVLRLRDGRAVAGEHGELRKQGKCGEPRERCEAAH